MPRLSEAMHAEAMVLAMSVRNALEGTLHGGELGELSLTDAQMARLNPVLRNALATALHARAHYLIVDFIPGSDRDAAAIMDQMLSEAV